MNRSLPAAAALTGLVLMGVPLSAQQMTVKMYTVADGLGHNLIHKIYSDREGILWFCTSDGVTRFDGQHFVNFNSTHGAPFATALDILETPGGDYWIGTRGQGVVHLTDTSPVEPVNRKQEKRFRQYNVAGTSGSNEVLALHQSKTGDVWLGTLGGLYSLRERPGTVEIRIVSLGIPGVADQNVSVYDFLEDPEGSLYLSTQAGIVRMLPGGGHVFYAYPPGYAPDDLGSLVFQDGVLWVGQAGGVFLLRPAPAAQSGSGQQVSDALVRAPRVYYPQQFSLPTTPNTAISIQIDRDSGNNYVFAVHKLTDGRIWLASFGGVFEFSGGGKLRRILSDAPFDYGLKLGQDAAGNMWIGTNGRGAARVSFTSYQSFSRSDGLGKSFGDVVIDGHINVLVPCWPRDVAVLSGERFKTFTLNLSKDVSFSGHTDMFEDHLGQWWVPATDGIYRFPSVRRTEDLANTPLLEVYRGTNVPLNSSRVFEDHRGDIWRGFEVSSPTTVTRWERNTDRWYRYSTEDGLPTNAGAVLNIGEDAEKNLWFAFSMGGLVRWKDGRFQAFGEAQGLPGSQLSGMTAGIHGRLWLALTGRGLARIDGEKDGRLISKSYALSEGVTPFDYVGTPLIEDSKGRIYVGLMHGVDRLDPSTDVITHYGAVDGVPLGPIWSMAEDPKGGGIWITSKTQVVRIRPDEIPESPPSPVFITGLRVSGVEYSVPVKGARKLEFLEFSSEKNSLQIDFMGLAFAARRSPVFQYRLEGSESAWSEPTSLGTVNYASLAPGDYRFEVREVPRGDQPDVTPAQFSFRILEPIWKRSWFIGLIALILFSALAGFERYRTAKLTQVRSALAQLKNANEALDVEAAISRVLAQSSDEIAFPTVLKALCQRTGWESAVFWERDRDTAVLRRAALWPETSDPAPAVLPPGQGLAGEAVEFGLQWWSGSTGSATAFPIRAGDTTLGAIELHSREPRDHEAGAATLATIGAMLGQWIERLRAERALRVSEARFRTLAATAPDAIVTIDEHGVIVFTNPSVSAVFGYTAEQMMGHELTMLMPPALREAHRTAFARHLRTGERRISWNAVSLPGLHADGHEMALELSFGEFKRENERFFTSVIRDVTERKRTEEALRRSREERLAEIERVRRRIATDLHDDIGASLTQISVLSEVVRQKVEGGVELERPLEIIAGSSRELIDSMSDIVWAINPQRDHLRDLVHRMRRFAVDTLTARNIEFTLRLPDSEADVKLEGNLRREVFLIFKEALNNAVRHSGCTRAEIELRVEGERLLLRVADNGKGFDTAKMSDGHGLASMRSRAEGIGGKFGITSGQGGQGSMISLEVPLPASISADST